MARLNKRWQGAVEFSRGSVYRWFLGSTNNSADSADFPGFSMGCIEAYNVLDGPFWLEIWSVEDQSWGVVGKFPTLKQAKIMGRLMAGIALNKGA